MGMIKDQEEIEEDKEIGAGNLVVIEEIGASLIKNISTHSTVPFSCTTMC